MNAEKGYLLLVEDDPDIRELLEMTLMIREYRVITAGNGRQALEIAQKEQPVLVIADIMMPHLDGYGLVHRLRIAPATRRIPVVFITAASVAAEDREFALKIGVVNIIPKPVDLAMFLEIVDGLLARSPAAPTEPADEFKYYDEYRRLLETKLEQKEKQIARSGRLAGGQSDVRERDRQESLRHAVRDKEEMEELLREIQKQLDRIDGR